MTFPKVTVCIAIANFYTLYYFYFREGFFPTNDYTGVYSLPFAIAGTASSLK